MLREADPFQAHRVSPSQTISPCEQTLDYLAYVPNDLNLVIFRPFAGSPGTDCARPGRVRIVRRWGMVWQTRKQPQAMWESFRL